MQDSTTPQSRFIAAVFDEHEHVDYELLEGFVDGTLNAADENRVREHAAVCPACATEIEDLRSFARGFSSTVAVEPFRWIAVAAVIGATAIGTLLVVSSNRFHHEGATAGRREARVTIRDATRIITLDRAGHVHGIAPAWEPLITQVLSTRTLGVVPSRLPAPATQNDALRGVGAPSALGVLRPSEVVITEDTPAFEWSDVDRRAVYFVEVFDLQFRLVVRSAKTTAKRWVPEYPLPRGQQLQWQVTRISDGVRSTAPQPPKGPARFYIVDAAAAKEIDSARATNSHLILAAVYARSGMRDGASAELDQLMRANPESPIIAQLV